MQLKKVSHASMILVFVLVLTLAVGALSAFAADTQGKHRQSSDVATVVDADGRLIVRGEVIDNAMPTNSSAFDALLNDAAIRYKEYRLANPIPLRNNGFTPVTNNYGVINKVVTGEQTLSSAASPGILIDMNAPILSFILDSDVFFVTWRGEQINLLANPEIYDMIQNGASLQEVFAVLGARD